MSEVPNQPNQTTSVFDRLPQPLKAVLQPVKRYLIDPFSKTFSTTASKLAVVYALLVIGFVAMTLSGVFHVNPKMKESHVDVSALITPHQIDTMVAEDSANVEQVVFTRNSTFVLLYRKGVYTAPMGCYYGDNPLHGLNSLQTSLVDRVKKAKIQVQVNEPVYDTGYFACLSGFWYFGVVFLLGAGLVLIFLQWRAYSDRRDEEWAKSQEKLHEGLRSVAQGGLQASSTSHVMAESMRRKFTDIAGQPEAIKRMLKVVHRLKYKFWYSLWQAGIPQGILLLGPAGCGKTLLFQVIAGEGDCNVLYIAGSEFVKIWVGNGALAMREFWKEGEKLHAENGKPTLMFIDEIDAIGRKRSFGSSGSEETDKVLTQLLVLTDGPSAVAGLILCGASNAPLDTLDDALLSRLDYTITMRAPTTEGRLAINKVHSKGLNLAPEIPEKLRTFAEEQGDWSGRRISKMWREVRSIAANRSMPAEGASEEEQKRLQSQQVVTMEDFRAAFDLYIHGEEYESIEEGQTAKEIKAVSDHEAGHAIVIQELVERHGGPSVRAVTRVPHSTFLGAVRLVSSEEENTYSPQRLLNLITILFAGRVAQLKLSGFIDSGAESDLERASVIARKMVAAWGMSALGPINIPLDAKGFPTVKLDDDLEREFSKTWRKIVCECYKDCEEIIDRRLNQTKRVSKAVLETRTVDGDEFRRLWNLGDGEV